MTSGAPGTRASPVEQRHPGRVGHGRRVAVAVRLADGGDRPPEAPVPLVVPAADRAVGPGQVPIASIRALRLCPGPRSVASVRKHAIPDRDAAVCQKIAASVWSAVRFVLWSEPSCLTSLKSLRVGGAGQRVGAVGAEISTLGTRNGLRCRPRGPGSCVKSGGVGRESPGVRAVTTVTPDRPSSARAASIAAAAASPTASRRLRAAGRRPCRRGTRRTAPGGLRAGRGTARRAPGRPRRRRPRRVRAPGRGRARYGRCPRDGVDRVVYRALDHREAESADRRRLAGGADDRGRGDVIPVGHGVGVRPRRRAPVRRQSAASRPAPGTVTCTARTLPRAGRLPCPRAGQLHRFQWVVQTSRSGCPGSAVVPLLAAEFVAGDDDGCRSQACGEVSKRHSRTRWSRSRTRVCRRARPTRRRRARARAASRSASASSRPTG